MEGSVAKVQFCFDIEKGITNLEIQQKVIEKRVVFIIYVNFIRTDKSDRPQMTFVNTTLSARVRSVKRLKVSSTMHLYQVEWHTYSPAKLVIVGLIDRVLGIRRP